MRALLRILSGLMLSVSAAPLAAAQSAIPTLDQLYQAAKAEGQVVFGGAIKEENQQKLAAVFQQRFPGIAIRYTRRSTEPMVQLVEAAIASVVSGERAVSWGVSGYRAIEAKAEGSPIELIVWDEGVALAQFLGVVPAKAPHPNAARLLLRWMMTPEGQELLVKTVNQYSARKDVTTTPLAQPPLSALKINAF